MAGCKTSDNIINVNPSGPNLNVPGFGSPFSPVQIPIEGFDLPTEILEDLATLMGQLQAIFPSSIFKASLDSNMRTPLDFIASILAQIAPFLSFYNFIMAALKLFACIIEVLCAIPNPFALIAKLKKLFFECIPGFLLILPWLALIAMILALLLLIISLVIYVLETIIAIISQIVQNILLFEKAIALNDAEASLAAIQKIASLLCFIQNLMAIFVALASVMAIIQALGKLGGFTICSDDDADGCCTPDICPSFIKNNSNGIKTIKGVLTYHHNIKSSVLDVVSLRDERWQLYDADSGQQYSISSIVTPNSIGQIFYPEASFSKDTPPKMAPYTADLRILIDPSVFNSADVLKTRHMRVKDCIVVGRPYIGVLDYQSNLNEAVTTGTLTLEGGKVYEDDGKTPYMVNGKQATLNTFIHQNSTTSSSLPGSEDGYVISDIELIWYPNHPILANYNLITIGCIPDISIEKAVQNAKINAEGIAPILSRVTLPDVSGAQKCVQDALDAFRKNLNKDTAAEFQATVTACLNGLIDQATSSYCQTFVEGVSQFQSTIAVDTDAQFTTRPIEVSVVLKDAGGTNISQNIPEGCLPTVLENLKASVTLGEVSDFTYDSSGLFKATITSKTTGAGKLTAQFNNKLFSTLVQGSATQPSSIIENEVSYTFIETVAQPEVRRDETDVAGND